MNKAAYCLPLVILILASCKKENPAEHAPYTAKAEALKVAAACTAPPVFLGIKISGGPGQDVGRKIVADASGVTLFGSFGGTVDFNPGPGTTNLTAHSKGVFAQRFNTAGNFTGAVYHGEAKGDELYTRDNSGNKYHVFHEGETNPLSNDPVPVYFYKYSPSNKLIVRIFIDNMIIGYSVSCIKFDNEQNIILGYAGRIYKFSSKGKLIWKKENTSIGYLFVDRHNNIYTTVSAGLVKYDKDGTLLWKKNTGANIFDMVFDAADNMYLAGSFCYTVDFDPGPETYYLVGPPGNLLPWHAYIEKLDAAANLIWAVNPGAADVYCITLSVDQRDIYIGGYVWQTATFNPITGNVTHTAQGEDAFILAYRQCK